MTYNQKLLQYVKNVVLKGRRPDLKDLVAESIYESIYLRGKADYLVTKMMDVMGRGHGGPGWFWNEDPDKAIVGWCDWCDKTGYHVGGEMFKHHAALHPATGMTIHAKEEFSTEGLTLSAESVLFYLAHEKPELLP